MKNIIVEFSSYHEEEEVVLLLSARSVTAFT